MRRNMKILISLFLVLVIVIPCCCFAEDYGESEEIVEDVLIDDDGNEIQESIEDVTFGPRDEWINRIITLGEKKFLASGGKAQRAHYASDIYVCKNFTVYLFRQTRDDFRIAEYPDVKPVIPNNLPSAKCKPYYYGIFWEDIDASKGNPFYVAAQFLYDTNLSYEENLENAESFMRNAQRGDYFQMSADYASGTGAHSAIMLAYDAATDEIHWMDSNMRGKRIDGIRYGYVQFDEVRSVRWWAETFCHKKRGATLYRLRDDIIYADEYHK